MKNFKAFLRVASVAAAIICACTFAATAAHAQPAPDIDAQLVLQPYGSELGMLIVDIE